MLDPENFSENELVMISWAITLMLVIALLVMLKPLLLTGVH